MFNGNRNESGLNVELEDQLLTPSKQPTIQSEKPTNDTDLQAQSTPLLLGDSALEG